MDIVQVFDAVKWIAEPYSRSSSSSIQFWYVVFKMLAFATQCVCKIYFNRLRLVLLLLMMILIWWLQSIFESQIKQRYLGYSLCFNNWSCIKTLGFGLKSFLLIMNRDVSDLHMLMVSLYFLNISIKVKDLLRTFSALLKIDTNRLWCHLHIMQLQCLILLLPQCLQGKD